MINKKEEERIENYIREAKSYIYQLAITDAIYEVLNSGIDHDSLKLILPILYALKEKEI